MLYHTHTHTHTHVPTGNTDGPAPCRQQREAFPTSSGVLVWALPVRLSLASAAVRGGKEGGRRKTGWPSCSLQIRLDDMEEGATTRDGGAEQTQLGSSPPTRGTRLASAAKLQFPHLRNRTREPACWHCQEGHGEGGSGRDAARAGQIRRNANSPTGLQQWKLPAETWLRAPSCPSLNNDANSSVLHADVHQDKPAAFQVTARHFLGRWNFAPFDTAKLIYIRNLRKHSCKPGFQACAMSGPSSHVTLQHTSTSSPQKLEGTNQGLLHSNYYCRASPPRTGL